MKNALTIDVEDWYQTKDFDFPYHTWNQYEVRIEESMALLLDLLEQYDVKATFFVLGCIAKDHPELVKRIQAMGHQIGSHGSRHELVYRQTRDEFTQDVRYSKALLEDLTGEGVTYFRSSSWSIGSENLWALEVLEQEGFLVDSSVQPFKTPLSGMKHAPITPFYPVIEGRKLDLLEFPPGVLPIGTLRLPFCGGFYLRAIPLPLIELAFRRVNRQHETLLYTHPWEYDHQQPRLQAGPLLRFVHYYQLTKTYGKLEHLLKNFEFTTMRDIISSNQYEAIAL